MAKRIGKRKSTAGGDSASTRSGETDSKESQEAAENTSEAASVVPSSDAYSRSSERARRIFLVVLTGIGALLIIMTACAGDWLASKIRLSPSFKVWECVALFWSLLFALYYFFSTKTDGHWTLEKLNGIFLVFSFSLPVIGIYSCYIDHDALHLICVVSLSWLYFFYDYFLWRRHKDRTQRDEYRESFFLADVPTSTAMGLLSIWIILHRHLDIWKSFASGVVAFQLITCNVIFVVTQLALHREGGTHDILRQGKPET